MFVRTATRKNKNGTTVRYLQLAHNEWDPVAKTAKMKVLHNFGREDQIDRAAVERLVSSLCRLLDPGRAAALTSGAELTFIGSAAYGGPYLLDQLWRQLKIDTILTRILASTRRSVFTERVLFALVANRALDASSKLAASHWIGRNAHIQGLPACSDDACYRAMDWLHQVQDSVERKVFDQVATLLNLEVDLLFFDTTSTYFQIDEPDEPIARDQRGVPLPDPDPENGDGDGGDGDEPVMKGFRARGKSKDHRDDLPQIVIGMAVTRDGIPVRVWSWPGNTTDTALIRQVKDDTRDWTLSKIVWVGDRGFASADNLRYLRQGDHHYIIGERLRSGSAEAKAALSRQGRYQDVADNLKVKEVRIGEADRFVICFNPDGATRDAAIRERLITQLEEVIAGSDALNATKRAELRGVISTKPGLNRYLRTTPNGLLRLDAAKVKTEANLDGKYLLRCSDPKLTAEDIAVGYKQLLEVERGWRDMKQIIDLRPVYHRLEERIRAHVILCWLALLLIRIIETTTGSTWNRIRDEFDLLTVATFTGPTGTFRQRAELTKPQRDILSKLDIPTPKKIVEAAPAADD
ncbi:IS1634 family transposase [Microbispora sp. H11081]|uniref:IS1634 family transposase n=1 Tax=Microbispora sp. H11081 TaxID=2729107 RepID=UPI0014740CAA|nr:IS1634 family transposase [Microbispora sp. H11081]